MTHHNIDYSGLDSNQKRAKAIADIIDYVGKPKFDELNTLLGELLKNNPEMTLERFSFVLFMFPVSGYPIQAWYETLKESN